MSNLFDRLLALAPPPTSPVNAGSPDRWTQVEQALSTGLPHDYKWLINTYGSGEFCDLLWLLNPFSPKPHDLASRINSMLEPYRDGQIGWTLKRCPFPIFPEHGGLLPLGGDTNGGSLFWVTTGSPEKWTLVLYDWRGGYRSERHEMPLVNFLVGWLSGEIPNCFFGVGIDSPIIHKTPVFCPLGMVREYPSLAREGEPPFGSESGYWSSHVFHLGALTCDLCKAVRDCSPDLDLENVPNIAGEGYVLLLQERTDRAIERARQEGWQLIGYPSEPKFRCPACGQAGVRHGVLDRDS